MEAGSMHRSSSPPLPGRNGRSIEGELDFRLCGPAADLQHGVGKEIDGTGDGAGLNHEVAAPAELDVVGWMVPDIVGRQAGTLVALALPVTIDPGALGSER